MKPIRLLIVDDHEMVLAGLQVLLAPLPTIQVVGTATTGAAALAFLQGQELPDVVLLDISLPDLSGIDVCRQIKLAHPNVHVLGLSTYNEKPFIVRLMQNGAAGYVLKNATLAELTEAITTVYTRKKYFSDAVQSVLLQETGAPPAGMPAVTRREREILALIADGLTNQGIAVRLFLSPLTVDTHRRNLVTKFGVNNTAAMIKLAAKYELI